MNGVSKCIIKKLLVPQVKANTKILGEEEYSFAVVPSALKKNCIVFSFGVGENISFDLELIKRYHAKIYGFDPTPKSIRWVKENVSNDNFVFFPFGLSDQDKKELFYLPDNKKYVSGSVIEGKGRGSTRQNRIYADMKCMSTIVRELGIYRIDLLKMDIEGSEFTVITDILKSKSLQFRQLCVEVHWRFFRCGWIKVFRMIWELNREGYFIASVSDSMEEITFVKKQVRGRNAR